MHDLQVLLDRFSHLHLSTQQAVDLWFVRQDEKARRAEADRGRKHAVASRSISPRDDCPMRAIIFDLFGTLVRMPLQTNPYFQLFASVHPGGANPRQASLTFNGSLIELARELGSPLPPSRLRELQEQVRREVAGAQLYPEVLEAFRLARAHGFKIAVSSNLAHPYADVMGLLAGMVDHWCLSFEKGFTKPDARMFREPAAALGAHTENCVVIGDSLASDKAGAYAARMECVLIDRDGRHPGAGTVRTALEAVQYVVSRLA